MVITANMLQHIVTARSAVKYLIKTFDIKEYTQNVRTLITNEVFILKQRQIKIIHKPIIKFEQHEELLEKGSLRVVTKISHP